MSQIFSIFDYTFFTNALLAALLTSIICGIVGTYIVTKRIVFITGGITHASFGGVGIAFYFGLNPILGAAFFAILSGIGIEYMAKYKDVREDSAIATLWSLGMALGIIFIFITPGYTPNLNSFLFGNILTVSFTDLYAILAVTAVIVLFFSLFWRLIMYISFDEEFAKSQNMPVQLFKYILVSLVALTIVINIRVVGIILVLSLITIPPTVVNLFEKKFQNIMLYSILVGLLGSLTGLFVSYWLNIPSGASIIFALVLIFFIAKIFSWMLVKRKQARA